MCKIGDIIVVKNPKRENADIGKHSFIVISTEKGKIEGLEFDLVCNIMGSFDGKGEDYRLRKLSYPDNLEVSQNDVIVPNGNSKSGYVKPAVLFYFDSSITEYEVIGQITIELYNKIIEFIKQADEIEQTIDNLK